MKMDFSVSRKICAIVLAILLVIGTVPMTMATDKGDTENTKSSTDSSSLSASSNDEAQNTESVAQPITSNDIEVSADNGKIAKTGDKDYFYVLQKDLKFVKIKFKLSKMLTDNKDYPWFLKYKIGDVPDKPDDILGGLSNIRNNTEISEPDGDGFATATIDLKKLNVKNNNNVPIDKYTLFFTKYENSLEKIEYQITFDVITDSACSANFEYDKAVSKYQKEVKVTYAVKSSVDDALIKNISIYDEDKNIVASDNGSFIANKKGKYTVEVTDAFDVTKSFVTETIKIDTTAPYANNVKFYKKDGSELESATWYNSDITVKVDLWDLGSGIDKTSIKVDDENVSDNQLETIKDESNSLRTGYRLTFTAKKNGKYTVVFFDNAEHSGKKDITIDHLDKTVIKEEDVTFKFSRAESSTDKVLNFLTFGAYSNNDLHIGVDVKKDSKLAPITEVTLYNMIYENKNWSKEAIDECKVDFSENGFLLSAPEGENSKSYNLAVVIKDAAGNVSNTLFFTNGINAVILDDGTEQTINDIDRNFYRVVLSNIVPAINKVKLSGFENTTTKKTDNDVFTYVSNDGTITAVASEKVTGLSKVKALINDEEVLPLKDLTDSKTTEYEFKIDTKGYLKEGKNEVKFIAVANSGKYNDISEEFYLDNIGPELNGSFTYSNEDANSKEQNWTNNKVKISFELKDDVNINSVKYCKSNENGSTIDYSLLNNCDKVGEKYYFNVEQYGKYTVVVSDVLNNESTYETEYVKFDNESPKIDNVYYNNTWTNKSVEVSFTVKDYPDENASGIKVVSCKDASNKNILLDNNNEGKYTFKAENYGSYKVVAKDNAGNESEVKTIDIKCIDKTRPTIKEIEFSSPENAPYNYKDASNATSPGIYNNDNIIMTVKASKDTVEGVRYSPINSLKLYYTIDDVKYEVGKEIEEEESVDIVKNTGNEYWISYTIKPENLKNLKYFSFVVSDEAGNEQNTIADNIKVTVNKENISDKNLKILASYEKLEVDELNVEFDNGDNENKVINGDYYVYSGAGKITTNIMVPKGGLSRIDYYETYFVKAEDVKFNEDMSISNLSELEHKTVANISKSEPVNKTFVEFTTPESLQSGDYYAIVAAYNFTQSRTVKYKEIYVDNSLPEIDKFAFYDINGSVKSYGFYSKDNISLAVECIDGDITAGISEIILYNGEEEIANSKDGSVLNFELTGNKSYQLKAKVIDVFGHESEIVDIKKSKVAVNDEIEKISDENFEVVVSSEDNFSKSDFSYNFDYSNENKIFKDNDIGEISTTLENSLSGIKDISISLNDEKVYIWKYADDNELNTDVWEGNSFTNDEFGKITSADIIANVLNKLDTGVYNFKMNITDMCGNEKEYEDTFSIDKTAPVISNIRYYTESSSVNNIINLLTFGLYSQTNIKVEVTGYDKLPSSGITASEVQLESKNNSFSPKEFSCNTTESQMNYSAIFELTAGEGSEDSFFNELTVSVADNFENKNSNSYSKYENCYVTEGNGFTIGENFDLVATKAVPEVEFTEISGDNMFPQDAKPTNDGDIWFSNYPTIKFTVTDNFSKIHSVEATITDEKGNKANITEYIKFYKDNDEINTENPGVFTDFESHQGEKINSINATINTELFKDCVSNGKNTITVYATGNNGAKTEAFTTKFSLDNVAPVITEIHFDKANKYTKYGLYDKDSVKMTVYVNNNRIDANSVSDLSEFTVSENDNILAKEFEKIDGKNHTYSLTYIIECTDNIRDFVFSAKDIVGNSVENRITENIKVFVHDVEMDENFKNIVVTEETPYIGDFEISFKNGDNKNNVSGVYSGGEGEIKTTISFGISPIDSYKAYFVKAEDVKFNEEKQITNLNDIIVYKNVSASEDNISDKSTLDEVDNEISVVLDTPKKDDLESGTYYAIAEATNLSGNTNVIYQEIKVDNSAPVINSIIYTPKKESDNIIDKVLNFLTFGLYSNTNITVEMHISDAKPSSGINAEDIVINSGSEEYKPDTFTEINSKDEDKDEVTYIASITLGSDAKEDRFFNDMNISVSDIFGNNVNGDFKKFDCYYLNNENKILFDDSESDFDIVSTESEPSIIADIDRDQPYNEYIKEYTVKDKDNKVEENWFSNYPTIKFTVTDNISKIHSIEATITDEKGNEANITEYIKFYKDEFYKDEINNKTGIFTDFKNHEGNRYSSISAVLDTSKAFLSQGKNAIKITAVSNNNMSSNLEMNIYFVDTTAPVIDSIKFDSVPECDIVKLGEYKNNYSYFFQEAATLTITASDYLRDSNGDIIKNAKGDKIEGSGVDKIGLVATQIDTGKVWVDSVLDVKNNEAKFTIPKNFKGTIEAYAIDNVVNTGSHYTPENTIVEDNDMHIKSSNIEFKYKDTNIKDNAKNRLYADYTSIKFTAKSTYAGIEKVTYFAATKSGQTVIGNTDITVSKGGSIVGSYDDCKTDRNLITSITKTVPIKYNANDIILTVIVKDRVGYQTKMVSEPISIDMTAPIIDVKYAPSNGNKVGSGDYYKENRTATITVTERNFNPNDFKCNVNKDGRLSSAGNLDWRNSNETTHIATVVFSNDGDYTLACEYTDLAGNKANNYNSKEFTIDKTKPVISVRFENAEGKDVYFKQNRTAIITIDEHNFNKDYVDFEVAKSDSNNKNSIKNKVSLNWENSGNTHTAKYTFSEDAMYSFTVDFKDNALNQAKQYEEKTFYIDHEAIKENIIFENVVDNKPYNGIIAPRIIFKDPNIDTELSSITLKRIDVNNSKKNAEVRVPQPSKNILDGVMELSYSNFEEITENDGIYEIVAVLMDKAGNNAENKITFSVNRFGSTFRIIGEKTEKLINEDIYTNDAPDIIVQEINVNNVDNVEIQVNRDDTIKTLDKSEYSIENDSEKTFGYVKNYRIYKNNFEAEGNYVITVSSTNEFKKVVSNRTAYNKGSENRTAPISFVVDKTSPIITISGIDSEQYYEEAEKTVSVVCDDANISTDKLEITLDNNVLKKGIDYKVTESSSSVEIELKIEADNNFEDRFFKVSITDKAGNKNKAEDGQITKFRLSASWFSRLLHYNMPLVIIVCVLFVALIGVIIFFSLKKRKNA